MISEEKIAHLPALHPQQEEEHAPHGEKHKRKWRVGHELSKTGMIVSLTIVALTGLRILRPMMPLHPIAGVALVGFALWHVYQKDQRAVHSKTHSGKHALPSHHE
ncbi:MAG: hypothetical protein HQL88_02905 [Magnetococcales bacterium]|nr:hypothetical protein [Magnetococcales bacterium]